jgi:hypothetical protein
LKYANWEASQPIIGCIILLSSWEIDAAWTLPMFEQPPTYDITDIPLIDHETLLINPWMQLPPPLPTTTAISKFV